MLASIVSVSTGDDPQPWQEAGFTVDGTVEGWECALGDVRLRFDDDGPGLTRWTVFHPDEAPGPRSLDGLDTDVVDALPDVSATSHPNGTTGLDHVVVSTPDMDRTTAAFASIGVEPRRTRDTTSGDAPLRQRFFRMGTIVELVGPPEPLEPGGEPARSARFWGLALVSADLDATAAVLGDRLGEIKEAVQPGRRIATLRTRELGISVPVAFMTPHRR